jgi:hypothetical protein
MHPRLGPVPSAAADQSGSPGHATRAARAVFMGATIVEDGGDQQSGRRVRTLPPRQRPLPITERALLLTDLLPARPCARSAGSGSGRCRAGDGEVPVGTRDLQRRKDQEEGCPSVDAVREANEAREGRDTATGNTYGCKAAEVAGTPMGGSGVAGRVAGELATTCAGVPKRCCRSVRTWDVSCGLGCPATPVTYQTPRAGWRPSWPSAPHPARRRPRRGAAAAPA